jgi:predicted transcriptional regulator
MIKDSLKALQTKAGISCSDWSKLSTVPEATIRKILSGETPDPRFDTIVKMVTSVGGSVDDIVGVKKETEIETNAVIVLKEAYESRIEALRERVADLKERAASDARDKRMLAVAVVALVLVLVGILLFDIGSGVSWV